MLRQHFTPGEREGFHVVHLPDAVGAVMRRLHAAGATAVVVGGAPRDTLRGVLPRDYDVATNMAPETVMTVLSDWRVVPTGLRFGTVTVLVPGTTQGVEVTTFRSESAYRDGRHPDAVWFVQGVAEDLARRDFTVNALAYDPFTGEYVDPFDGRRDILLGLLRAVGSPERRFQEDALRMMRAARFMAQLGFRVTPSTSEAVLRNAPLMTSVSRERIRDEWSRLLVESGAKEAIHWLVRTGLWHYVVPGADEVMDEGRLAKRATRLAELPPRVELRLAGLYAEEDPERVRDGLNAFRYPRAVLDGVESLQRAVHRTISAPKCSPSLAGEIVQIATPAAARDVLALLRVCSKTLGEPNWASRSAFLAEFEESLRVFLKSEMPVSVADLAVRGGDLLALGVTGPAVGKLLERLLRAVWTGDAVNTRESLIAHFNGLMSESP